MATGLKANNIISHDAGTSWEDRFQIDAGGLTNATRANFFVQTLGNDVFEYCECLYTGASALTIAEFNNLPIGTRIFAPAITTPSVYLKTAATTWKLQAINT